MPILYTNMHLGSTDNVDEESGDTGISDDPDRKINHLVKREGKISTRKLSKLLRVLEVTAGRGFFRL